MHDLSAVALVLLAGCSNASDASGVLSSPLADGGTVVVGTPCAPVLEESATFGGSAPQDVEVETVAAMTSGAAVCLAFHFQGRVTCPYGQSADGGSPDGKGCETPDGQPVTSAVQPQCVNRTAAVAVTWSCRCANVDGQTDDGPYCNCPMGTTCAQAVLALGSMPSVLSGAYCVPTGSVASADTCSAECDPVKHPCP
jgi:hypothetical protein